MVYKGKLKMVNGYRCFCNKSYWLLVKFDQVFGIVKFMLKYCKLEFKVFN